MRTLRRFLAALMVIVGLAWGTVPAQAAVTLSIEPN
jgi:hypothetical protein